MPKHDKDEQRARELRMKLFTEPGQCPVCDEPCEINADGAEIRDDATVRVGRSCIVCSTSWVVIFRPHDAELKLPEAKT